MLYSPVGWKTQNYVSTLKHVVRKGVFTVCKIPNLVVIIIIMHKSSSEKKTDKNGERAGM